MSDDRANQFLNLIRRSQRGRLKVYLGYGPGIGKTCLMLQEGHRLVEDGIDVVVGLVETHGREGTEQMVEGLEVIPRLSTNYHGITIEELDVDAVLARKPQVVLIDELAHTNVPGSRNDKRYQDVHELIATGIHVISTVNIQHLESLYDTVERQIGIKVRERIPDSVLAEADQVVNVDLAPDDLQRRLTDGKIYPKDRIPAAMENYFKSSNLEQLRELTMRELASQIDFRRREIRSPSESGAPDQIMVCLSSRGPNSARLLRYASRIAGRLNRTWYALYVQTPQEDPLAIDASTQRHLSEALTLAHQLGATVFTFKGIQIPQTIIRFAREYRVGHIVIGKPRPLSLWRRLCGQRTIAEHLIRQSHGETIVIVDAVPSLEPVGDATAGRSVLPVDPSEQTKTTFTGAPCNPAAMLDASLIQVWSEPVARSTILASLVQLLCNRFPEIPANEALELFEKRERLGSTYLSAGITLPHIRMPQVSSARVALGIARAGLSDPNVEKSATLVFAVVSPSTDHQRHLQFLAAIATMTHDRDLRRRLDASLTPESAFRILNAWHGGPTTLASPTP